MGDEARDVELAILFTFWDRLGEVLVEKLESPPYTAFIELLPAFSADVLNVAVLPFSGAVPSAVVPRRNVIVPVGVPYVEVTVAVKVTIWP